MKMSIDEFLDFFDLAMARTDQEIRPRFLDMNSRRNLDTICTAETLFKGTVVDFDRFGSHSGGGNNATNSLAVN